MGIAVLTLADLLSPLQALATRWMAPRRRGSSSELRYVAIRPGCTARNGTETLQGSHAARAARPLRVVRVVDSLASRGDSRVVISGRMADVCAELDRLAALEAHALSPAANHLH